MLIAGFFFFFFKPNRDPSVVFNEQPAKDMYWLDSQLSERSLFFASIGPVRLRLDFTPSCFSFFPSRKGAWGVGGGGVVSGVHRVGPIQWAKPHVPIGPPASARRPASCSRCSASPRCSASSHEDASTVQALVLMACHTCLCCGVYGDTLASC